MEQYISKYYKKQVLYFLYDNDTLVYIGKSNGQFESRITAHLIKNDKTFTKIFTIILPYFLNLAESEMSLIQHFNPKYNKTGTKTTINRIKRANLLIKRYNIQKTIIF